MIDPQTQSEILRLFYVQKLSIRQISRDHNLDRRTLTHWIRLNQVLLKKQSPKKRISILSEYYHQIQKLLSESPTRSVVNILQRLRPHGYKGGITILKNYLSQHRPRPQPPQSQT